MVDAATVATDSLAAFGHNGRIYVVPEARLLFVSVAKNACTALKWMVADIAGEDPAQFRGRLHAFPTRIQAIHDRHQWRKALRMEDVPADVRRTIHPDNGWLVLAVVRDPRARLFSAWQQKLLLANPAYRSWQDEDWAPRFPDSAETIVEDFAAFVRMLAATSPRHQLLRGDTHFRTQRSLLQADLVPYTRIYDIGEMRTLRDDVEKHVRSLGIDTEVVLRRSNDTPLRATAAAFEGGIRELVEELYADDFEDFGERWDFAKIAGTAAWTEAEITEVQVRRELGERLGDMREAGLEAKQDAKRLRAANRKLRRRVAALEQAAAEPLTRRLARRLTSR